MREKFCMRCGTPLNGAARCPECGYEPMQEPAPAAEKAPQQTPAPQPKPAAAPVPPMGPQVAPGGQPPYGAPPYAPSAYGARGGYPQPYAAREVPPEPLTMGRTIGTLLVGALPLVGWIVLLIWAFESGAEPNRRTLARSYLVVKGIGWGVVILFYVLLFAFSLSMVGAMY